MNKLCIKRFWNKRIQEEREKLIKSPFFQHKNKIIVNFLKNKQGRLLDIGVGYGFLEEELIRNKKSKLELYGIDISDLAIKKIKEKRIGKFIVSSITKLPFKANYFDYVLALDVLEHLSQKELLKGMKEISRVIKNKGTLIISVPINESNKDFKANMHVRKYNLKKLEKELKIFNFFIQDVKFLTAFKNIYLIKNFVNSVLKIRKPNLLIVIAVKQE